MLAALLLAIPFQTTDIVTVIETEGGDTVAAETYYRRPGRVTGRIIVTRPARREATYRIDLGEDGLPRALTAQWRLHEGEPTVEQSFSVTVSGGMIDMRAGDGSPMGQFPAPPNAVATVGRRPIAYGLLQVLADAALDAADGQLDVALLVAGEAEAVTTAIARTGDVLTVDAGAMRIDATLVNGLIDTARSTQSSPTRRVFNAQRALNFDLDAFLARRPPP